MRKLILMLFLCQAASAVTHSVKYFYTASSGVPNLPQFVVVGLVDDVEMIHYDSNTETAEPKQDWMDKVTADDPQYWEGETVGFQAAQQVLIVNIETAKQRFNQTGGVHIVQVMTGCEWDDDTGEVTGYEQQGYDGEDFIVLDLNTETWVAAKPQAVITKHKWDLKKARLAQRKNHLTQICPEWLKKYLNYGRSSLMRTVRPSVSLLQKTPSSPVSCHATGFYPHRALMFWTKDGEELHEDVDQGEILPNHDGTFQMSVDLDVSSVEAEDWRRYDCVFQLYGLKDDIVTKLDSRPVDTNRNRPGADGEFPVAAVVVGVVVAVVLVLVSGVAGFFICRKNNEKQKASDTSSSSSSSSSSRDAAADNITRQEEGDGDKEPDTLSDGPSSPTWSGGSDAPLIRGESN